MSEAAAHLVGTPQWPVPDGASVELFDGADGARLRAAWFPHKGPSRGSVLLSPGRSESIEKYFEVIEELRGRGLTVAAHDWRGQGLSHRMLADRRKGHAEDWRHYIDDHQALVAAFESRLPRPRIALTHSMGGCLVSLALQDDRRFDGAVFTAPMFGIQVHPAPQWLVPPTSAFLSWAGRRAAYVSAASADPLRIDFDHNQLTHDRARWEAYRTQLKTCPELGLGGATWGWLDQAFRAMALARRRSSAAAVDIPLTILGAGQEAIVVNAYARDFAAAAPLGRYVEIAGSRHEIMMETDAIRAVFWREFDDLLGRLRPPSG